jgi:hypothetical protein
MYKILGSRISEAHPPCSLEELYEVEGLCKRCVSFNP